MRPFFDDYDELDESSFDDFAATRRLLSEKQRHRQHHPHQKGAGRKRHGRARHDRWAGDNWDSYDEYDDYNDDEFDRHYGLRFDD